MRFLISLLLCAACSQPFSQGSTSPQLPSLLGDADLGSCDELDGAAHPGATSYYLGEFEGGDGTWLGTETWLLYANETWESDGQGDCEVVWDVSANETIPSVCSACDLGLQVSASIDLSRTDCPEPFYKGSEMFEVQYDVLRSEDGSASWFFSASGNALGEGYYTDTAMNYLTSHQCAWF